MGIITMRRKLADDTVSVTTTSSSGSDYRKGNRTFSLFLTTFIAVALSINSLATYASVHSRRLPLRTNLELEWKMALVATAETTPNVQQSAAANDSPVVTTGAYTSAKLENKTTPIPTEKRHSLVMETFGNEQPSHSNLLSGNATLSNQPFEECFPYNSKNWLQSQRMKNIPNMDFANSIDFFAQNRPSLQPVLDQSICPGPSRFTSGWQTNNQTNIHKERPQNDFNQTALSWVVRLTYLAVAYHQHQPAMQEYLHRKQQPSMCQAAWGTYNMSVSDYECSNAKFLIAPLPPEGLGANLNLVAGPALRVAVATGRILHFVNHAHWSPQGFLQASWSLASCDRKDYQCFFMPPSPCVPTRQDVAEAFILERPQIRTLFAKAELPTTEPRVITWKPNKRPQREPPAFRETIAKLSASFVKKGIVPNTPEVQQAIRLMTTNMDQDPKHGRAVAYEMKAGLTLYFLRPQPKYQAKLQQIEQGLVSATRDYESLASIGLPIRASDKCDLESQCFSFDTYMHAAQEWWLNQWPNETESTNPIRVMVTTESPDVVQQQMEWMKNTQSATWQKLQFQVFRNSFDVTQGTGLLAKRKDQSTLSDDIMLSVLSSIRAQFSHRVVLGNCCSNFHKIMQELIVHGGCSSRWDSQFVCLQHHPNESFQLCCAWDRSERCTQSRAQTK